MTSETGLLDPLWTYVLDDNSDDESSTVVTGDGTLEETDTTKSTHGKGRGLSNILERQGGTGHVDNRDDQSAIATRRSLFSRRNKRRVQDKSSPEEKDDHTVLDMMRESMLNSSQHSDSKIESPPPVPDDFFARIDLMSSLSGIFGGSENAEETDDVFFVTTSDESPNESLETSDQECHGRASSDKEVQSLEEGIKRDLSVRDAVKEAEMFPAVSPKRGLQKEEVDSSSKILSEKEEAEVQSEASTLEKSNRSCFPIRTKLISKSSLAKNLSMGSNVTDSEKVDVDRLIELHMEQYASRRRLGFGRFACRSAKEIDVESLISSNTEQPSLPDNEDRVLITSHSRTESHQSEVVPASTSKTTSRDIMSSQAVSVKGCGVHAFHEHLLIPPDDAFSSCGPQSLFTFLDDTGKPMDVAYSCFGDSPRNSIYVRTVPYPDRYREDPNSVVVKVEASTISPTDCAIRNGNWWGTEKVPLPNVPGVDLVGLIERVSTRAKVLHNLNEGDRVISLVKWGGNSRYADVRAEELVLVPKDVDPFQAVCLAETYLSAFQALQVAETSSQRYRDRSLFGKSVLVIGAMSNIGRAVIELAKNAGARRVFGTAKEKQHHRLAELGAIPLKRSVQDWFPYVEGAMDLVIDVTGAVTAETATMNHFRAMNGHGHLVFISSETTEGDTFASIWMGSHNLACRAAKAESRSQRSERIHVIDVFKTWERRPKTSKRDLLHLLRLLRDEAINPIVLDRIPLAKVARAQETLELKRLHGFLVCDPWIPSKQRAVYL